MACIPLPQSNNNCCCLADFSSRDSSLFVASMARAELALGSLFYLYPFLLTLTLVGAQCVLFFRNRRREAARIRNPSASEHEPKQQPRRSERIRRTCAWLIWLLQLIQSGSLLASISLAAKEAAAFPFSAYLVSAQAGFVQCASMD
jgi:hypothetical protein